MLRLRTNVTSSPTMSRRSWSATSATRTTSGPRAPSSVTISSMPTSCRRAHPPAPRRRDLPPRGVPAAGSSAGGVRSSRPGDHDVSRARLPCRKRRARRCARRGAATPPRVARTRGTPEARREHEAAASVASRSRSSAGQGRSGLDVVDGQRRHAAPVVDARREQRREVVAQVGRRLQVHVLGRIRRAAAIDRGTRRSGTVRRGASRCPASAGSSARSPLARDRARGARSRSPPTRRCAPRASRRSRPGSRW